MLTRVRQQDQEDRWRLAEHVLGRIDRLLQRLAHEAGHALVPAVSKSRRRKHA